jgi:hypothetical protein
MTIIRLDPRHGYDEHQCAILRPLTTLTVATTAINLATILCTAPVPVMVTKYDTKRDILYIAHPYEWPSITK